MNLKSLDISLCNSLFMSGQLLSKPDDVTKLTPTLSHLEQLNIASIRYMSDVTFSRLVRLCSNLRSLNISGNKVVFHSGNYCGGKLNSSLLTFSVVLDEISRLVRTLRELDMSRTPIHDLALEDLARTPKLQLTSLKLVCCRDVTD